MIKRLFLILLPFAVVVILTGCGEVAVANTGTSPVNSDQNQVTVTGITSIADILGKSADFAGKAVVIEGKITQECGSGCWFNLADESGVIYVDLAPNNLSIPQKVGSKAKVTGVVTIKNNTPYLIVSKVEF